MPVLDANGPISDAWVRVADDAPVAGTAIVSFDRLQKEGDALFRGNTSVGVEIPGDAAIEKLLPFLERLQLIVVRFPTFRDGRGFSTARLLRDRHNFKGDLRAAGDFLPDQVLLLLRCGVSTFEAPETFSLETFKHAITAFTAWYQRGTDTRPTVFQLRHTAGQVPHDAVQSRLKVLRDRHAGATAQDLVRAMVNDEFRGRVALVSSFGSESAVLLHMIAQANPATDVVFLDTGKLFGETRRYRDELVAKLGLTNVHSVTPDPVALAARDAKGVLWSQNADACCHVRKVEPLARALAPYDAWFTGRKAFQSGGRMTIEHIEFVDGRFKINPLAGWTKADLDAYFTAHDLPRHPLEADGFLSIGCMPCTSRVAPGEDARAGRWRGLDKSECGIHLPSPEWKEAVGAAK